MNKLNSPHAYNIVQYVVVFTILVMCIWGMCSVVFVIRPFWIDEWRIIYNLKIRDSNTIWGQLAFMQQFPRTYLYIVKQFSEAYSYSYQSLRLLPFIFGICTICYSYFLSGKIFGKHLLRFLFVMMLLSSGTFTQYFVEVKQYTMELLLSVAAIGQLLYLLELGDNPQKSSTMYVLFCIVMFVAPFFSYTYPIVIAPVFGVMFASHILNAVNGQKTPYRTLLRQWLPLFLTTFGCTIFYAIDVAQVSADTNMHLFWQHLLGNSTPIYLLPVHIFHFLAQPGSGLLFWWLFGICGVAGLVMVLRKTIHHLRIHLMLTQHFLHLYAILLIVLMIVLNLAGKLPLGEPRLNAFGIPGIALLVTGMLQQLEAKFASQTKIVTLILLAGLTGNIFTTVAASVTGEKYQKRMEIYHATENAIELAQSKNYPILVTPEVAWPYNGTVNYPFDEDVPGDWVLMSWPAYNPHSGVAVYAIPNMQSLPSYLQRMPADVHYVVAGDGRKFTIFSTEYE